MWCKKCDPHVVSNTSKLTILFIETQNRLHQAAEYELMRVCALCGFNFAIPPNESPFDLLVDFGQGFKKVQVKSSYCRSGANYTFALSKSRHNSTKSREIKYDDNNTDYFFLYDWCRNKWLIPFNLLQGNKTVTPILKYPGYRIVDP